jgi:hypothetical protein
MLLLQHPVLCWYLSSGPVIVLPDGWVRRQLCEPLSVLFQAVAHLPPTLSQLLLQAFFTDSLHGEQLLAPFPLSSVLRAPHPACPFRFLVYYSGFFVFFCFAGLGSVCPGAMLVYPRGDCGNTACHLFTHLWSASPNQVWSWHLVVREPFCFLSVMFCGEALCRLGVQVARVLLILCGFSAKCGSSISARFLIYGAHAVCVLPLVAILDLSQ